MLEFVLPVTRSDLLSAAISSYWVNEVVSGRHLAGKVQGTRFHMICTLLCVNYSCLSV